MNGNGELRIVVFSTRGLGFPQQLDQIEAAAAIRGGRVVAVVTDVGETDNLRYLAQRKLTAISSDAFFANAAQYAGCLVVDRTCTWYPGVRYKVRLRQLGFAFLRAEQFLNAPGLEFSGGSYRGHSDLMLERFDEFLALERHWKDELSKQTYYYSLAAFISMNHEYFAFHCGDYSQRYFPDDVGLRFDESTVYADCGSHDGQEILIFAKLTEGRFKAVHAFEPDGSNFIDLSNNMARYIAEHGAKPIYCHEMGVYDRNAFLRSEGYSAGVSISAVAETSGTGVHVCKLDDTLDELSHLRLEIEGAELEALNGARRLIVSRRPTMTVSAYHKPTDFPDLLAFIEQTDMNYSLALRHQSLEPGVLCIYAV
ncbi:hypothetical protein BH09PSE5_BH09PSE5_48400 [soil metagenome]